MMCAVDIGKAAENLAKAGIEIAKAVKDCASSASECTTDIGTTGSLLSSASQSVEAALKDCGNISSACANDISAAAGSLSSSVTTIGAAETDCQSDLTKCVSDVKTAAAAAVTAMQDLAQESTARIITASSYDGRHPPEHILDPEDSTFWSTTGTYPQEFVLQFGTISEVAKVKVVTTNVRNLTIEKCEGSSPTSWEKVTVMELEDNEGRLQVESVTVRKFECSFLKFRIENGHGDHSTVHRVFCEGRTRLD